MRETSSGPLTFTLVRSSLFRQVSRMSSGLKEPISSKSIEQKIGHLFTLGWIKRIDCSEDELQTFLH